MTDDDILALLLPNPFDELLVEVAPSDPFPPPIAGADIISDVVNIWNAVSDFAGAVRGFFGSFWGWVVGTWNRVWDTWLWFWEVVLRPALNWLWDKVHAVGDWLWYNAINPVLGYIVGYLGGLWNRIWEAAQWLWNSAVQPALNYLWALVSGTFDWLWRNAIQPSLQWVYNRIWDTGSWFWTNAIQPALSYLWALVSGTFTWLWDSAIRPSLDSLRQFVFDRTQWIYDHIISPSLAWLEDRLHQIQNIGQEAKDVMVNNVWPVVRDIPTALPGLVVSGGQLLVGGIRDALDWLFNHVFDPIADAIQTKLSIPRKLLEVRYANLGELLDDLDDPVPFGGIFAGFQAAVAVPGIIMSMSSEVGRIIAMDTVQQWAQRVGATLPTLTDLRDAYLRGWITQSFHDDQLSRMGFKPQWVNAIRNLYFEIPPPSDLIRMAVREAFTPDIAEAFGQYENFPPAFGALASGLGIGGRMADSILPGAPGGALPAGLGNKTWPEAYWAAHWDLPSPTQGFTMLQRALTSPLPGADALPFTVGGETYYHVIDFETLQLLLRALDVMPFWRDKLTAINYRPVSRIDIRRMFATGSVDRRDVLRTYLSLGYYPEDAVKLADWVTREAAGISKDLSREVVIKAYREGRLTRDQAIDELLDLGYADDQVDLLLDLADVEVADVLARLAEDVFEADFKAGVLSEGELRAALAFIGVPERRIELLVRLWTRQLAVKPARLSTSQVQRLYHEGIVSRPQAEYLLAAEGYNPTAIGWLIQLATPEPDLPPARELSKEDLRTALRQALMSEGEVRARLTAMGWKTPDADLLLTMWRPEPKEADLTKADLRAAFRSDALDTTQVRDSLQRQGYDPAEIESLLAIWTPAPEVETLTRADLRAAFRAGILDQVTVLNALIARGYSPDEAAILVDTWTPAPAAA